MLLPSYPTEPDPGNKPPKAPPRDADGKPLLTDTSPDTETSDDYENGIDVNVTSKKPYTYPGCSDKTNGLGSAMAIPPPPVTTDPTCDVSKASDVPSNVFGGSGTAGNVYDKFCAALTFNNTNGLPMQTDMTWTFDSTGNKTENPANLAARSLLMGRDPASGRILGKRSPPPNPASYSQDRFVLTWKPGDFINNACNRDCGEAYAEIIKSPCGHAGNSQNIMVASSTIEVGCGSYSVDVVKGT